MREILFIALALACPLMMIFMMRGHGHSHGSHSGDKRQSVSEPSVEELRRQRDDLDRLIAEQETASQQPTTVVGGRR